MEHNPELTPAYLAKAIDKLVKRQARDTIRINVRRDPNARYARVPGPGACDFCKMLGSRGFVYHSEAKAGAFDDWHGFCNCQIAVSFDPFVDKYEVMSSGGTIVTVTRGYADDALVVRTGRDGSTRLRDYDIDDLYAEYKAMSKDFNRGSRYRKYGPGVRLSTAEYEDAVRQLESAGDLDELHETGERIVREWEKRGRPNRTQFENMSLRAKELEKRLEESYDSASGYGKTPKTPLTKEEAIEKAKTCKRPIFCFTDDHLFEHGQKIRLGEDKYHIVAHGTPESLVVFGVELSPEEVMDVLETRDDYHGESIALISCSTGDTRKNGTCYALELSRIADVPVIGATRILWTNGTKHYIISDRAFDERGDGVFQEYDWRDPRWQQ